MFQLAILKMLNTFIVCDDLVNSSSQLSSSPKPKALGLAYSMKLDRRSSVRLCVRPSNNTFKHEYHLDPLANRNQILGFLGQIRSNSGFHGNR